MAPLHCRITENCLADSPKRVPRRINYDLSAVTRATRTLFKLAICSSSPVCVSNYRHEDIRWVFSLRSPLPRALATLCGAGSSNRRSPVADFDKCKRAFTVVFVTAECLNFLLTRTSAPGSFSNEIQPWQWYIHGAGATSEYLAVSPNFKNPADTSDALGIKITIVGVFRGYFCSVLANASNLRPRTGHHSGMARRWNVLRFSLRRPQTLAQATCMLLNTSFVLIRET